MKTETEPSPHPSETGEKEAPFSEMLWGGVNNLSLEERAAEKEKGAEPKEERRRVDVFLTEELNSGTGDTGKVVVCEEEGNEGGQKIFRVPRKEEWKGERGTPEDNRKDVPKAGVHLEELEPLELLVWETSA